MATLFHALAALSVGILFLLCTGMVRRSKLRHCYTFSAYIAAATLFGSLILLFPEQYTPEAFMVKQGIYDSLLFGMSLELAVRAFAAFGGMAAMARKLLATLVGLSTVGIFLATPGNAAYTNAVSFQPGVTTAGIWCLTFVALLIVWYQIPVPAFTRSILLGYVPYLVVFTVYMDLISRLGWGAINGLNIVNAVAYDAVAGYWAYAAWRKD